MIEGKCIPLDGIKYVPEKIQEDWAFHRLSKETLPLKQKGGGGLNQGKWIFVLKLFLVNIAIETIK